MKELRRLEVTQVRIFSPDAVPFEHATVPDAFREFVQRFQFPKAGMTDGGELELTGGKLVADGARAVIIKRLLLHPQKLTITVDGSSQDADSVFAAISEFFAAHDPRETWKNGSPLIKTEETSAVIHFDFAWRDLFSTRLMSFLDGHLLDPTASRIGSPHLKTFNLSFRVRYSDVPDELAARGIGLADKTFTIEPRVSTTFEEQTFFTLSPYDSDTHLRLAVRLEEELLGRRDTKKRSQSGARA